MKTFEELVDDLDIDFTTKGRIRIKDAERIAKEYARIACEEQKKLCDHEVENGFMASEAPLPEL